MSPASRSRAQDSTRTGKFERIAVAKCRKRVRGLIDDESRFSALDDVNVSRVREGRRTSRQRRRTQRRRAALVVTRTSTRRKQAESDCAHRRHSSHSQNPSGSRRAPAGEELVLKRAG